LEKQSSLSLTQEEKRGGERGGKPGTSLELRRNTTIMLTAGLKNKRVGKKTSGKRKTVRKGGVGKRMRD